MGTRGTLPRVKRPGREADRSPPSNAEVKNAWSYISTPPMRLHAMVLKKELVTMESGKNLFRIVFYGGPGIARHPAVAVTGR
jgi:hypothetical protein